jgi:predicted nucleic acid-binding protein
VIVLDSTFFVAFYNERDAHHNTASVLMERFLKGEWGRGLLLEYVFLEVMTVLLVRRDLGVATRVGRLLLGAEELDFVPCSGFFSAAFEMFAYQGTTRLSFADAAITRVAQERAGGLVLTFDGEFVKVPGIRVLGQFEIRRSGPPSNAVRWFLRFVKLMLRPSAKQAP